MNRVTGLISANYASDGLEILTENRTIASLPFAGRYRFIDFPLSNMVNSGIETVGLMMPYKYRSIIDHVGAGKEWGLDRKNGGLYILPGSVFGVSNVGKSFLLRDFRRNMVFFERTKTPYVLATSASSLYNIDYKDVLDEHIRSSSMITMICKKYSYDDEHMIAVDTENGRVKSIRQGVKAGDMAFMDGFIVNRDLLMDILEWYAAVDYMDFFSALSNDLDKIMVHAFELKSHAAAIHTVKEYFESSMGVLDTELLDELFSKERPIMTKALDTVPSSYSKGCKVENSLISAGCTIKGSVKDSILFRGVVIEEGAVIKNSILMQDCVVKKDAQVENAIIDRNNSLGEGMVIKGTKKDIVLKGKRYS